MTTRCKSQSFMLLVFTSFPPNIQHIAHEFCFFCCLHDLDQLLIPAFHSSKLYLLHPTCVCASCIFSPYQHMYINWYVHLVSSHPYLTSLAHLQ
jgi:hypothetical protein